MSVRLDIKPGRQFGRFTILSELEMRNKKRQFLCRCDCGTKKTIPLPNLTSGGTRSCGCLLSEKVTTRNLRHGLCGTRIYRIWVHMIGRCYNPKDKRYSYYGGRGIIICEEWRTDVVAFRIWALANGYRADLTIDRIDNDGNYEPGNCRWTTWKAQQNNRSNNALITHDGETLTVQQWSERIGIRAGTINWRLNNKWPISKVLTQQVRGQAR